LQLRMADITADELTAWQSKEAETRANNARQGFELFRAFWRWCASRPEFSAVVDVQAVEDKDLRAEVPARKSKRFDVLERAQLPVWFAAVRGLGNPVMLAYLQGLLLTGARREELAALRWQDVDFQWGAMWIKDKVAAEGRKIPLTPYLAHLLAALPRRNAWVFSSPTAADGKIAEPRIPHNRALSVAGLEHVTLHGLRRTFASLAEWVEMPRGVVAQIMGHAPNATAEKHYINRPLELLAVWHGKYEAWILEQAGIRFQAPERSGALRVVK
jgi:integrase